MGGNKAGSAGADGWKWDFFVSYAAADRAWAEWISWQLEEAGFTVLVQAWDFVPGAHWMSQMTDGITGARRTLAVLSHAYLGSVYGQAEWQAAFSRDPQGLARTVIPVRVQDCPRPGLLDKVVSFDLFDLPAGAARQRLLDRIGHVLAGRAKPTAEPMFPGGLRAPSPVTPDGTETVPTFPGGPAFDGSGPGGARLDVAGLPAEWELVQELDGQAYNWPGKKEFYRRYRVFAAPVGRQTVRIGLGETDREAWGRDRTYVIAFLSAGPPHTPLVEFLAVDDHATSRELVAIIRGSGGERSKKMYGPGDPLPETYQRNFRIQLFADRISFSGAWKRAAVVARDDDEPTLLNHALLQARRRGDL